MKRILGTVCILGCVAFGATNGIEQLVTEMPVTYEVEHFSVYKTIREKAKILQSQKDQRDSTTQANATTKKTAKAEISNETKFDTQIEHQARISGMGVGAGVALGLIPIPVTAMGVLSTASLKTRTEFNNRTSASLSYGWSSVNEQTRNLQKKVSAVTSSETEMTSGEYTFEVAVKFVNRSSREYVMSGKGSPLIHVKLNGMTMPIGCDELTTQGEFRLMPNASKVIIFKKVIDRVDYRTALVPFESTPDLLRTLCKVQVEEDFPLHLADNVKDLAFSSHQVNPIEVEVRFGDYKNLFPLYVGQIIETPNHEKTDVTVGLALRAVAELCYKRNSGNILDASRVLGIDEKGLATVCQMPFGELVRVRESNGFDNYKMVMMRTSGKWMATVSKEDLNAIPQSEEGAKRIVFDQISAYDVVQNPDEFSEQVKLAYVNKLQTVEIDGEKISETKGGQWALGCLYWSLKDEKNMIKCFAKAASLGADLIQPTIENHPLFWEVIMKGTTNDIEQILADRRIAVEANKEITGVGGVDADARTILSLVIEKDDLAKYRLLKRYGVNHVENWKLKHLFLAAKFGSMKVVDWLLNGEYIENREKINVPDERGYSPLMYAAVNGRLELCKYLIDNGADVDAKAQKKDVLCSEEYNPHGNTRNYIDAMRRLKNCQPSFYGKPKYEEEDFSERFLPAGIDVNYRWNYAKHDREWYQYHTFSNGWTFLEWAMDEGNVGVARMLLDHGAPVNVKYRELGNQTPLCYAIRKGKSKMVDMLLAVKDIDLDHWWSGKEACSQILVIDKVHDENQLKRLFVGYKVDEEWKEIFLYAVKNGNLEAIRLLVSNVTDLSQRMTWIAEGLKKESSKKVQSCLNEFLNEPHR